MDNDDQDDQSKETDRLGPTIHVDSSCKLVTIAGSGKIGKPFQLVPHLLFFPRISSHLVRIAQRSRFSC